ncbi:MBL fold metallo-hydrolase [Patescibacteria group bacterium]|nr:MBL fold metallo-hydrolase [Patescibacteria group bacterium]
MAKIKVLIEGYAKPLDKGWKASCTTCLITTNDKKIITDPGCNRVKLLEALAAEDLNIGDIDYVFLSHRHPDHILLAGLFENAKYVTFDGNMMYNKDVLLEFDKHCLGSDIEIVATPGHVNEHLSLIVDTSEGKVAIAGDVIWWLDSEEQNFDLHQKDHNQAVDLNMDTLVESRKKLLKMADYIIPGHGKRFKVDK